MTGAIVVVADSGIGAPTIAPCPIGTGADAYGNVVTAVPPALQATAVTVVPSSCAPAEVADEQEDKNNFGGPPAPFTPMVPAVPTETPLITAMPPVAVTGVVVSDSAKVVPAAEVVATQPTG